MQSLTTVVFLCIYAIISVVFAVAAYLSGQLVEDAYGSQISLIYFLCTFLVRHRVVPDCDEADPGGTRVGDAEASPCRAEILGGEPASNAKPTMTAAVATI